MGKTAIVAGATGMIGKVLVRQLLDHAEYDKVIALVRRPASLSNDKLIQVITDWSREDLARTLREYVKDADVFCALGTTMKKAQTKEQFRKVDYEYPLLLGQLAKEGEAARFLLVSSMGANRHSRIFYSQVKGEVEEGLRKMGLRSLLIFRPSLLLGHRDEFRRGEKAGQLVGKALSFLMIGMLRQYKPIAASAVGEGMIRAANSSSTETVRIYSSDQITP